MLAVSLNAVWTSKEVCFWWTLFNAGQPCIKTSTHFLIFTYESGRGTGRHPLERLVTAEEVLFRKEKCGKRNRKTWKKMPLEPTATWTTLALRMWPAGPPPFFLPCPEEQSSYVGLFSSFDLKRLTSMILPLLWKLIF